MSITRYPAPAATVVALTDSSGGTANSTLVDVGLVFTQANINDNFADLTAKVNTIIAALKAA